MNAWFGWPAIGLFVFLLGGATGWGRLGLALLARWHDKGRKPAFLGSRAEEWYLSVVLGLGIVSWLGLLLGLARLFYPTAAWGLLAMGWALGALSLSLFRGRGGRERQDTPSPVKRFVLPQRFLAAILVLLGAGSLLYMLVVNGFMPPFEWDEIAYHMALAKIYVRAGGIIPVPFIVHSNWPMNTEMLFSLSLLLGSDLVGHLVTWWMSLWTAAGLYLIGRRFLDRRIGLLAAVLYLTVPLVKRLSGTGLIDVSLPFYGTAAFLAYAHYRQKHSLAWIGLAGLFSGLAAGSKLMGGAYPLFLGLLIVLDARIPPRLDWRPLLTRLAVFWGLGFLMVGPWYGRSYAFTGNPLWPFLYQVFGGKYWDALGHEYHMASLLEVWTVDLPLSLKGLLQSFYYLFFEPARLGGYEGGLGQVVLGLAGLSVLWVVAHRRIPRLIYLLFLFSGLYYIVWFAVVSPQVRFLFVILPPLALMAAFTFYFIWDRLPHETLRWILVVALVVPIALKHPAIDRAERDLFFARWPYATGQLSQEDFLDAHIKAMPAFRYINAELPPESVVLLLPYESRGYYLDRPYVWGHPISQRIIPFEQYDDPLLLAQDLRNMGITHILENPEWLFTELCHWEHDRALMLALESQCGEIEATWNDIVLYRLVRCRN